MRGREAIDGGIKLTYMKGHFSGIINLLLLGLSAGYISPSCTLPVKVLNSEFYECLHFLKLDI